MTEIIPGAPKVHILHAWRHYQSRNDESYREIQPSPSEVGLPMADRRRLHWPHAHH